MGESFSAQLSTGIGTYAIPISLPAARGDAQPSLGLAYSSAGGHGLAGVGWDMGVPFIARQIDRGLPHYDDRDTWHPNQDRFVYNGGQELVPLCTVSDSLACDHALDGEVMPSWSKGWQYFRPRVEGSFLRFFWSKDHRTWRVQDKGGITMELGASGGDTSALEVDPQHPSHVFRWNLAREWDAHADQNNAPTNVVLFRYDHDGALAYLTDVYDTPPPPAGRDTSSGSQDPTADPNGYAHHVRIRYEARTDPETSYRRGWATTRTRRLSGIDVASMAFAGGTRHQVRRYHLTYDDAYHVSLLSKVEVEGRCAGEEADAPAESSGTLPATTSCTRLPAITLGYTHVTGKHADGSTQTTDLPGYEPFDERLITMNGSPDHFLDEERTGLFDIDGDALPDVLVTDPSIYAGKHGVYFQGRNGKADTFTADTIAVSGIQGADAGVISLHNLNVNPLDIDGNGIADLLHMPQVKTYAVYSPEHSSAGWVWQGRAVNAAAGLSPTVDFGKDSLDIRVLDVNGDGLVDVVATKGTAVQTYYALGRYPKGDGAYGTATWTSGTTATLSADPEAHCVPWAGTPVRFSDPDIRLADLNGDGLSDIVRFRQGDVRYWPARGNGVWGTGDPSACVAGGFAENTDVAMTNAPPFADPNASGIRFDDVNGDGLDDMVQVRFDAIDVWLNVDGVGWTDRHVLSMTPPEPSFFDRVQLADVNGSGTRDVLWGSGGNYQYVDLTGGAQPWLLNHVANGLGKTTDIDYAPSTTQMLAAAKAGAPWASTMPIVTQLVTDVTERDHLGAVGRTDGVYTTSYTYRDPVYDGRQREFRGFRDVVVKRNGDANSPTSSARSVFLLGSCVDETPTDGIDACSYAERWRDNPREALKGLPTTSETFDENGVYLATSHSTYRLRHLYLGLDAREVRHAFVSATDSYLYDAGAFTPATSTVNLIEVERDDEKLGSVTSEPKTTITLRSTTGRAHTQTSVTVDAFGNKLVDTALGCTEGCATDETITSHTVPERPAGDTTGWLFRTVETWVEGSRHPGKRQHHFTKYQSDGEATETSAELLGTLPLDRFHAKGDPVAGAPPNASHDGTVVLSTMLYDLTGNLTYETGPDGRCRSIDYADDPFATFPMSESVMVGGVATPDLCGPVALTTSATYDRGYGAILTATDLHGERTKVAYDDLGRMTKLWKPSAKTLGAVSSKPSLIVDYLLPTDATKTPFARIHTQSQDGPTEDDDSYLEHWSYVDGMGRSLIELAEADPTAGDGGAWVASGYVTYDTKGATAKGYLPWFWDGDGSAYDLAKKSTTSSTRQRYDAFGRTVAAYGLDAQVTLKTVHHALSMDAWDAEDLAPGPHGGTYASTRTDGHGRTIAVTERVHVGGAIEAREVQTTYLPSGPAETITRVRVNHPESAPVQRWMQYDTWDRMVLNVDLNTTAGFQPFGAATAGMHAWRYAYDDAGDPIGTSDARGCGVNYLYDNGGRLLAEDYSPCEAAHGPYSPASPDGTGGEVTYLYDVPDPNVPADLLIDPALTLGRLTSTTSRAAHDVTGFDPRGRVIATARQLRTSGTDFSPTWFEKAMAYDGADRLVAESTGLPTASPITSLDGASVIRTAYTARGTIATVGGSYGPLVTSVTHDADGLALAVGYGDIAHTQTSYLYDDRRRVKSVQTMRGPPALWTNGAFSTDPANQQLLLEDSGFEYDHVDNPTALYDYRTASEWPAGAKPRTRRIAVDDLYRVTSVTYGDADDTWVSPQTSAAAIPSASFANRIRQETFAYDWLGNVSENHDDQNGFWDRSIGYVTNGGAGFGPYQLAAAQPQKPNGSPSFGPQAQTHYDAAGNLTWMKVATPSAIASCAIGASCDAVYALAWDEVGRLVETKEWNEQLYDALPTPDPWNQLSGTQPTLVETYGYDDDDARVFTDKGAGGTTSLDLYVFPTLEAHGVEDVLGAYDPTAKLEAYAIAAGNRLAHVVNAAGTPSPDGLDGPKTRVLLELPDHLGGAAIVVDKSTSEVVEKITETAWGRRESDLRFGRWDGFQEEYAWTDKEDDQGSGFVYFGKRWFVPQLGRWLSADPLAVHSPGSADLDLYAYSDGRLLFTTDPDGLTPPTAQEVRAAANRLATVQSLAVDGSPITATLGFRMLGGGTPAEIEKNHQNALQRMSKAAGGNRAIPGLPQAALGRAPLSTYQAIIDAHVQKDGRFADAVEMRDFIQENEIGYDCAGFAQRLLYALARPGQERSFGPGGLGLKSIGEESFDPNRPHAGFSRVDSLALTQPGDVVHMAAAAGVGHVTMIADNARSAAENEALLLGSDQVFGTGFAVKGDVLNRVSIVGSWGGAGPQERTFLYNPRTRASAAIESSGSLKVEAPGEIYNGHTVDAIYRSNEWSTDAKASDGAR